MGVKFANNFETTISGSINSSVTTIAITSATGFPSLGLGDYAYCTLQKELPATHEIVKVTAISGTSLTVVRAQEGTTATAFADGDAFELRITATGLTEIATSATLAAVLLAGSTTGGTDMLASTDDKVQFRDSQIFINSSVDSQLDIVADGEIQIAAPTVDLNGDLDVSGTATAAAFAGPLTGNATTATALANARTIGGVSFDGSANINLPGVNAAGNQNTSGAAATVTGAAQPNITSLGTLTTLTSGVATFNGAVKVTGQNLAHSANTLAIGQEGSGVAQLRAYGPDGTTAGQFQFLVTASDGTPSLVALAIAGDGYVHMAGAADVRLTLGSQGTAGQNSANWIRGNGTSLSYNAASANHIWEIGGAEKMRIASAGQIGIGGTNYGSDGQVLTSTGASSAPAWEDAQVGDITGVTAGSGMSGGGSSGTVTLTNAGVTSIVAGSNVSISGATGAVTITSTDTNTTYSVGDGGLTTNDFTNADHSKLNGIAASATNTAAPYYTSAIAVGAGGLTQQNFTTTLKNKLDGIAASANNYTFPYSFASSATANAVVRYDGWGYLNASYISTTPNTVTSGITKILVEASSDGYIRHGSAAGVRSFLNVENGATADQTAAQILAAIKTVDGSGSGLDADTLDGQDSAVYFKGVSNVSGWQNSNANFSVRTGSGSSGLHMEGSGGQFGFQLYGDGTNYGFLDGEWASWDIQKVTNGAFKVDEGSGLKRVLNEANWSAYVTAGGAYNEWAIKVSNYTAVTKDQLICNSQSAFTVTLPSSPSAGDTVVLKNVAAGLITIGRNGSNINSAAEDATLPLGNAAQLVYVASAIGWTVL